MRGAGLVSDDEDVVNDLIGYLVLYKLSSRAMTSSTMTRLSSLHLTTTTTTLRVLFRWYYWLMQYPECAAFEVNVKGDLITQRGVYMQNLIRTGGKNALLCCVNLGTENLLIILLVLKLIVMAPLEAMSTITWVLCSILLTRFSGLMTELRSFKKRRSRITNARKKTSVGIFVCMTFSC